MIIPCLQYRDPHAAIDWLRSALGLDVVSVHELPDGTVVHAELSLGAGVVMLGAARGDAAAPNDAQSIYLVVPDADAAHARAAAAGATLVRPLADTTYGSREFAVRDPDGHVWSIGTYAPTLGAAAT